MDGRTLSSEGWSAWGARRRWANAVCASILVGLFSACRKEDGASAPSRAGGPAPRAAATNPQSAGTAAAAVGAPGRSSEAAYPRGRWRLASSKELAASLVWFSHILVRHAEAEPEQAPFTLMPWNLQAAPSRRTRAQAYQLARQLEERLRSGEDFASLARQVSEDPGTRRFGGQLGAISAAELSIWPGVLDALATLRPGELSRPVETECGIHILQRQAPPDPTQLAGRRLVIGHRDAPGLDGVRRRDRPPVIRSRDEALQLARALALQLQQSPESIAALVEQHSDAEDHVRGGDIGVWSNRERSSLRLELLALAQLGEGRVSDPVDTPFGFQILVRDPVRERPAMGASMLMLPYLLEASEGSDGPRSRGEVARKAAEIRRLLESDPSQLSAFQKAYCCTEPQRWSKGRAPVGLLPALDRLGAGELTPVIETGSSFVIARRLDSGELPELEAVRFAIPAPLGPDLQHIVSTTQPGALARFSREFAQMTRSELGLSAIESEKVEQLHTELATQFEASEDPEHNLRLMREAFTRLEQLLDGAKYARYRELLDAWVEARVYGLRAG